MYSSLIILFALHPLNICMVFFVFVFLFFKTMHNNENVKCISHVASCSLERDLEVDNRQRIHQALKVEQCYGRVVAGEAYVSMLASDC